MSNDLTTGQAAELANGFLNWFFCEFPEQSLDFTVARLRECRDEIMTDEDRIAEFDALDDWDLERALAHFQEALIDKMD